MMRSLSSAVLVVDDEKTVTDVLEVVLKKAGLKVQCAATAGAALKLLFENQFGCLLIDKNLPDKSGLEVIAEARRLQPYCANIVMTGFPTFESILAALRLGAVDYLEKPFPDLALVTQKVDSALKQQQVVFERDSFADALKQMRTELKHRDKLLARQQTNLELLQELIDARVEERTRELREELAAMKTPIAR